MSPRLLAAALLSVAAAAPAFAAPETYELDATHTYPSFEINHLGFSVMRGSFTATKGTLMLDNAAKKGSVDATVDVSSVSTGYGKRDDHLRSKDFFNAAQFPTMEFKADNFDWDAKATQVAGNLTLLGVTKPLTVEVAVERAAGGKGRLEFEAQTRIDRLEFGMNSGFPLVSREVRLTIRSAAAPA